jgi:cytochrome c biogenesis protein CcmG/thiol:disulfide interchange protein DsbE
MKALRVVAVAAVLALLGLLVWDVAHQHGGHVARDVDKGQVVRAPAFNLPRLSGGGRISLASLRGHVVVMNFWASDCVPCVEEQPELTAAARKWASKGVIFLGVDEQEVRSFGQAYVRKHKVPYESVTDSGELAGLFGVTGTPETFFIDRKGRVVPPHIVAPPAHGVADLDAGIERALKA